MECSNKRLEKLKKWGYWMRVISLIIGMFNVCNLKWLWFKNF